MEYRPLPAASLCYHYVKQQTTLLLMHRRIFNLIFPILLVLSLQLDALPSFAQAGSAYDLIAAVNQLRTSNGLASLEADSALFTAAQVQSDYQASIASFTHSGEGGSSPGSRAAAAGYGGSGVTENIAGGMDLSPSGAVSIWLRDALHTNTMLGNYTDVGAGAALSGGVVYYTLLVGNRGGAANVPAVPAAPAPQIATATPSAAGAPPPVEIIPPIQTSTPDAQGSIYHVVQPGENPVSIAEAYGIDLGTFLAQNDLIQNPLIFPGDTLIIRLAPTATPTIETTPTRIPTRTPRPTREPTFTPTALPPSQTPTQSPAEASPTPPATGLWTAGALWNDPLLWAIGVLALTGFLLIVVGSILKRGT